VLLINTKNHSHAYTTAPGSPAIKPPSLPPSLPPSFSTYPVVRRLAGALEPSVGEEEEVVLNGVAHARVHHQAWGEREGGREVRSELTVREVSFQ